MASFRIRTVCWTVHRWIGVALAFLLVPVAVSGALLVWHDELDGVINPGRYAVTGSQLEQSLSAYLASSAAALPRDVRPVAVRFPPADGGPMRVMARGASRSEAGPPRIVNVYLDPPTGRVLEVVDFRSSFFGWLHRFHENLAVPQYSGRAVVGWVGVGMLIMSLTGIWLWWPRNGAFLPGLRWGRAPQTTSNLHHLLGFWISIPLAVVSLTGVYLGFPQNARLAMASVAPMNPPMPRPNFGAAVRDPRLTPDAALQAAQAVQTGARPAVIFLPTAGGSSGQRGRARGEAGNPGEGAGPVWRVQLTTPGNDLVTLTVNDRSGAVVRMPDPLAGDRAAQWIRRIHDGSRGGPVWQFIVFLTGIFPAIFAVTGIVMWWRGRRIRKAAATIAQGRLQAAE